MGAVILNSFITCPEKIYWHFMKNKILYNPDHWEELINPRASKLQQMNDLLCGV